MKRILFITVYCVILGGALLYIGDYLSLRYRIPGNRQQFGSITVQRSYAVVMKNKKTEYMFDPPAPQECVHSLFRHFGDPPCWYLSRHTSQQINVGEPPRE